MDIISQYFFQEHAKPKLEGYYNSFIDVTTDTGSSLPFDMMLGFFGTIILVSLIDFVCVSRFFQHSTRYFILHSLFNSWVTITVFPDSLYALINPIKSLHHPYASSAIQSTSGIAAFHLYHLIVFNNLTFEDWVHHIVNSFFIPLIGIMLPIGKIISVSNLGMCGLPGGLDYMMLVAVKSGKMNSLTEKRINRYLHLLIRLPIQLIIDYIAIVNYAKGTLDKFSTITLLFIIIAIIAQTGNCVYYTIKVIENYAVKAHCS